MGTASEELFATVSPARPKPRPARKLKGNRVYVLLDWLRANYTQEKVVRERVTLVKVAEDATKALGFEVATGSIAAQFKHLNITTRNIKTEIPAGASRNEIVARLDRLELEVHHLVVRLLADERKS